MENYLVAAWHHYNKKQYIQIIFVFLDFYPKTISSKCVNNYVYQINHQGFPDL
jgi:hypothetical protein